MHELRDATKTAEGIHLVLRALADREQKVTPALDVAELVMVQAVGEEDVVSAGPALGSRDPQRICWFYESGSRLWP